MKLLLLVSLLVLNGCVSTPRITMPEELACITIGNEISRADVYGLWEYQRRGKLTFDNLRIFIGCSTMSLSKTSTTHDVFMIYECLGRYALEGEYIHVTGTCDYNQEWEQTYKLSSDAKNPKLLLIPQSPASENSNSNVIKFNRI